MTRERSFLQRLADRYYLPSEVEISLYRRIGVHHFGRYVPTGGSRFSLSPSFLSTEKGKRERVEDFARLTLGIELGHLMLAVSVVVLTYYMVLAGFHIFAAVTVFVNVTLNFYPIFLQRYNRSRATHLLRSRSESKVGGHA